MAQVIDWKDTNEKGTAQNALFHGITLEVGPLLANGGVPWSGTDFIRDAHIEEVEPNLASARRAAEEWARKQAALSSPESTPKAKSTPRPTVRAPKAKPPGALQLIRDASDNCDVARRILDKAQKRVSHRRAASVSQAKAQLRKALANLDGVRISAQKA